MQKSHACLAMLLRASETIYTASEASRTVFTSRYPESHLGRRYEWHSSEERGRAVGHSRHCLTDFRPGAAIMKENLTRTFELCNLHISSSIGQETVVMNKEAQAQSENKPVSPMPPAAALKLHLESCNQRSRIFDMMKMLHNAGNMAETTSGRIPHIHIGVCAWAAAHQCIAAAQPFQAETDADNVIFFATRSASARP